MIRPVAKFVLLLLLIVTQVALIVGDHAVFACLSAVASAFIGIPICATAAEYWFGSDPPEVEIKRAVPVDGPVGVREGRSMPDLKASGFPDLAND